MEGRVFTFAGLINHNHDFIIGFYTIVVALLVVLFARLATNNMKIIPTGIQNVY